MSREFSNMQSIISEKLSEMESEMSAKASYLPNNQESFNSFHEEESVFVLNKSKDKKQSTISVNKKKT